MRIQPDTEGKTTLKGGCTIKADPATGLPPVLDQVVEEARQSMLALACHHTDPAGLMGKGTIVVRIEIEHDPEGTVGA